MGKRLYHETLEFSHNYAIESIDSHGNRVH